MKALKSELRTLSEPPAAVPAKALPVPAVEAEVAGRNGCVRRAVATSPSSCMYSQSILSMQRY